MTNPIHRKLTELSTDSSLGTPEALETLTPHASARVIVRMRYKERPSLIGVVHDDVDENTAFVEFSKSFREISLPVPEIMAWNKQDAYIETDLGDTTLYNHLKKNRSGDTLADETIRLYKRSIETLTDFQVKGLKAIDTDLCYQGQSFDVPAIIKDYDAFIKEYAARVGLEDEAQKARADFETIVSQVSDYQRGFFLYRDFQARNIMIVDGAPFFIDYQSGREGPLAYDLASLLFQASANLPYDFRDQMVDHYLDVMRKKIEIDRAQFKEEFILFVLMRAIQVMGAYGRLGLGEGKEYFLNSIPYGKKNLQFCLERLPQNVALDSLKTLIEKVAQE